MRWVVRLLSLVVMLALVALGLVFLIPADRVAAIAARHVEAATGRALEIGGGVRPTVWPHLGVSTGPVRFANAGWSDAGPMIAADALAVRVDMAALIGGDIRITGIEVEAPRILLERAADGRANWDLAVPGGGAGGGGQGDLPPVTLDRAMITDGAVRYIDHASGQSIALDRIDMEASLPDFAGPADLALTARMNGQAVGLSGRIGAFGPFLAGQVAPVDVTLRAGDAEAGFEGRFGHAPVQAGGRIEAALGDLSALMAALGQPAPALPEGFGRRVVEARGDLTLTPDGGLHLRDGALRLDGNRLTLAADLTQGAQRPRLEAQISSPALDLSALADEGGGGAAPSDGWSRDPMDLAALGALDADIALSAQSVDLGIAQLGATRARIALDDARAVIDLAELAAYEGAAAGQVVVNGRGAGSARADLDLRGVALQPLLRDLAGYERLIGTADMRFNLLGSGNSVHALMSSLSGEGWLEFGRGELQGLDLAGMLRSLDPGHVGEGQRTIFESIAAGFTVEGGVLRSDDLALAAPLLQAAGAGTVDLGARTLDYRVTPVALAREDGSGGLRVPLAITGPWDSPRFRLDAESLMEERLEAEREQLEQRARERIAREAEERLGIVAEEGESLEDAARRRLEEEAVRGLGRLLRGN